MAVVPLKALTSRAMPGFIVPIPTLPTVAKDIFVAAGSIKYEVLSRS